MAYWKNMDDDKLHDYMSIHMGRQYRDGDDHFGDIMKWGINALTGFETIHASRLAELETASHEMEDLGKYMAARASYETYRRLTTMFTTNIEDADR